MNGLLIRGARENNLRSIDLDIPRNKITVITGVSGSGKSSLAFDVVFREARRLYLESFSSYARQFMGKLGRAEVDRIEGLSPVIAVGQTPAAPNPRSTVGTLTEIYDDLRLLFARLGSAPEGIKPSRSLFSFNSPEGACPSCRGLGVEDRIDPDLLIADPGRSLRQGALAITTPSGYIIYSQVTMEVLDRVCRAHGFDIDIPWKDLAGEQKDIVLNGSDRILIPYGKHPLESRMKWKGITARPRVKGHYKGILPVMDAILRQKRNRNILRFARTLSCRACGGRRLKPEALSVLFRGRDIAAMSAMTVEAVDGYFRGLVFETAEAPVGVPIREAVLRRTALLLRLGLGHLVFDRESSTLAPGESRRIRLAAQAGNGLRGVLYILDEPSVGLHPAESGQLVGVLRDLRDNGNTVLVVEHDDAVIRAADHVIDLGPGPGVEGGRCLFSGRLEDFLALPPGTNRTRDYLAREAGRTGPARRRAGTGSVTVAGARARNLKGIDAVFHLGAFNAVTGVSGAGKATLVKHILARRIRNGTFGAGPDAEAVRLEGRIGKVVEIDQSPIGRTPRSNPATYTGVSDRIRDLFAARPEAVARGWGKGRFSFNVPGGRCESCLGAGLKEIGMHFLGNVEIVCPVCEGRRFNDETLEIRIEGRSIRDVLEMDVAEAAGFFRGELAVSRILDIMTRLGLGYLKLGQSSTTLSGGEAQRIRLASELGRPESGRTLYILEEPTTGLHPYDVENLITALAGLVDKGNTVVAIEHDPRFIAAADYVIDLGPGSGPEGGRIVASGTPEEIAASPDSLTGESLRQWLSPNAPFPAWDRPSPPVSDAPIFLQGVSTHNLRDIDVRIPYGRLTVITGPSGSGKSSLAFDTLYAESLQRYIESFSPYVRSLIAKGGRADIGGAFGLTPPIAVGAKAAAHHHRSTVGTITGIYDDYRLLFSRAGDVPPGLGTTTFTASMFSFNHEQGACERCKGLGRLTVCDPGRLVTAPARSLADGAMDGTKTGRFYGEPRGQYVAALMAAGRKLGIDFGVPFGKLDEDARRIAMYGTGDVAYDIVWSYQRGTRSGDFRFRGPWKGFVHLVNEEYERKHADDRGRAMLALMKEDPCPACRGARLKPRSLAAKFRGLNIAELSALTAREAATFFNDAARSLPPGTPAAAVVAVLGREILGRLESIRDVGLDYLAMDRDSSSLSGGEAQRLRLAGELGGGLAGVTYVLDEPTIGLHPRDTEKLVAKIGDLAAKGNTVVVVEHDPDVIGAADHVIEIGPGAGREGGRIVAEGTPQDIAANPDSPTGRGLASRNATPVPLPGRPGPGVRITGASVHNLRNINVEFPSQALTVVTGVSGSGKSSLVFDVLLASALGEKPIGCDRVEGLDRFDRIVPVDQGLPEGGSRSIPATRTGIFDAIRGLFAATDMAKSLGFNKQHFSFLTREGRCETCGGDGSILVSMDFLADVRTSCEVCGGSRYKPEVLQVKYLGKTIAEVLELASAEAISFFSGNKTIVRPLATLSEIGLGYLRLGQPFDTLSGGEAQRLKLATALTRPASGPALYLFDEPTTGLHFTDVARLLEVFGRLIEQGHALIVIEHNLNVIARAHHVIDLGPEGGDAGGAVIASGTPAEVRSCSESYTGAALRRI
jgi:excinuclease ABC subunit A